MRCLLYKCEGLSLNHRVKLSAVVYTWDFGIPAVMWDSGTEEPLGTLSHMSYVVQQTLKRLCLKKVGR